MRSGATCSASWAKQDSGRAGKVLMAWGWLCEQVLRDADRRVVAGL
jgi:hypothetical protein